MTEHRIIGHAELRAEMGAVARGERPAPADAGRTSFNSVEALTRLLTPENRQLLATIRDNKPQSVAELAELTGRASSNLTRTLEKLCAAGLVRMQQIGRRKAPQATVGRILVEIDPFGCKDKLDIQAPFLAVE